MRERIIATKNSYEIPGGEAATSQAVSTEVTRINGLNRGSILSEKAGGFEMVCACLQNARTAVLALAPDR